MHRVSSKHRTSLCVSNANSGGTAAAACRTLMGAVTYIDEKRRSRTFRFDLIKEHGCSEEISTRLQYVLEKVETMIHSSRPVPSNNRAAGAVNPATTHSKASEGKPLNATLPGP